MKRNVRRRLIVVGVVALTMNLALVIVDELLPAGFQSGPTGSSFSTRDTGTAAFADLLQRNDQPVRQITKLTAPIDAQHTVVLLDAPLFLTNTDRLLDFVESGGRLIVATPAGDLSDLIEVPPEPSFQSSGTLHPIPPTIVTPEGEGLVGRARRLWQPYPNGELLAGTHDAPFALRIPVGDGEVIALASSTPLQNERLASADNAAFAVAITGGRPTAFIEYVHGFTTAFGGSAILTANIQRGLTILGLAVVVGMIAVGIRWKPPERERRVLGPPRRLFIDSVGDTLARTSPSALEPLQLSGRRLLATRLGHAEDHPPDELVAEAPRIGLTSDLARSLFRTVQSDGDALAVGAAHAHLVGVVLDPATANVPAEEGPSAANT